MTTKDFNKDWQFAKSAADWPDSFTHSTPDMETVTLPHTWNADDMTVGTMDPYIGAGWYKKTFDVSPLESGQRLLLEFEGATNCHKVWVNGGYAGGRNGGFLPTIIDTTEFLVSGENTVLVRVDNSFNLNAAMPSSIDWNRYGGITRPVWMHTRDHAYLTVSGVEISTPEVSDTMARTVVTLHLQEESLSGAELDVRHTLLDPEGQVVSITVTPVATLYSRTNTIEVELPVLNEPQLWSDVTPALYTVKTEILEKSEVIDERDDRIGYRYFTFTASDGFVLNGKSTQLRGANIHIFFPGLGSAVPKRFHRSDMELMKQMGCNYMRTSHYPRPKECLDACDELGIMVLEEQPYWHGSLRAYDGEAAVDNTPRLIRDMVRNHRNHPSIIAWNTVNEVMLAPCYERGMGHLEPNDPRRKAWAIQPDEYPYLRRHLRKMVDTFKDEDPGRPVCMVVGGAWQKNDDAELTSLGDVVAYNGGAMNFKEGYVGPKTGKAYEFRPDYYRELYPNRVHMMSEGILNDICFERGDYETDGIAWKNNARYWSAFGARPWFCGGSMWCFTDYSANGLLRLHGVVDRWRLPKDLFYFYQAMWSHKPVLHILGHWNYQDGETREVVVFTNCDDVELSLNGRSLGCGESSSADYPFIDNSPRVWKGIAFEPGKLIVTGNAGEQQLNDIRYTAGDPEKLELFPSNRELLADGRDISYIDITVCDGAGNRCYTSDVELKLSVAGAALLAGAPVLSAPGGLARFAVRSNGNTGDILVTVTGDCLGEYELELTAEKEV